MITFTDDFKLYILPWISLAICLYIAWYFYKHVLVALHDKVKTRRLIYKKQRERDHTFQKLEQKYKLESKYEAILALSPDDLLTQLKKKKLTAMAVLDAFMAKAIEATKKYNCVTEFIPQAHIWAAQLDEMKEREIKGPFHGLPISVKDNMAIEGMDSTLGFGKNLYKPQNETAMVVKALMDLGAVPFVKTNCPQLLSFWGCGNPIFGETQNPLNPFLSPGGSSGGEASLIASGGSFLGVGTDMGGCCRIPAHFCGLVGLKPTKGRISPHGMFTVIEAVGIQATPGFLSSSATLTAQVFKELTMLGIQCRYDLVNAVPIPWNEKLFTSVKPLCIGYYTTIPYFPSIGDTESVIIQAKSSLEAEGHTLVPFELPDTFDIARLLSSFLYADDGWNGRKIWRDEPVPLANMFPYLMYNIPVCFRKIVAAIIHHGIGYNSKRYAAFLGGGATKSRDLWDSFVKRETLLEQISNQWAHLNLDLVICPCFPFPAVPSRSVGGLSPAFIYTMIWNLFGFPSGVVRFGYESGVNIDSYQTFDDRLLEKAKKAAKGSKGMPIGVQVVGLPFQEELVLRVLKELEYLRGPTSTSNK